MKMKISGVFLLASLLSIASALPELRKRDDSQNVLTDQIWTSTSSGKKVAVTPTAIDDVTISASPVTDSATAWNSLDSSGIPYRVTPSVSNGKTTSASPTPTDTSYPEATGGAPPVLRCMNDRVPSSGTTGYPFCIENGTELVVGQTYWITWDPTYWGGNVDRVRLQSITYPLDDDASPLFNSDYISNNNGYHAWYIKSSYKSASGYFWLTITPLVTSDNDLEHTGTKTGPLLRIVDSASDASKKITRLPSDNGSGSTSTSKSSDVKTIVPAVVVPVVVIIFIATIVIFYFHRMKQKGIQPSVGGFFNSIRMKGSKKLTSTSTSASTVGPSNASMATSFGDHTLRTESISENPFANQQRDTL